MLHIKISGETPRGGVTICKSCKCASVTIGQNCEERIVCGASPSLFPNTRGVVTFKVSKCSSFHPINMPWKYEMEEMAWIVQARRRGPAGFAKGPEDSEMIVTIKPPGNGYGPSDPTDTPE